MPPRRRWTPVKGTATRVSDPVERAALFALDAPFRAAAALRRPRAPAAIDPAALRDVLILRLDRIGDVLMSLPALHDIRRALPAARIRLAVGRWSEDVARTAPVDEILLWSAPWAGRGSEGADSWRSLYEKARALRGAAIDAALDLQGDIRAALLMRLTGARARVGYANTGGAHLLTHVVPLDETAGWVEQNRRAAKTLTGGAPAVATPSPITDQDRAAAARILADGILAGRRPLVGLHPSGGRAIKQWDVGRWREVARRLLEEHGAALVVTGSAADHGLARAAFEGLPGPVLDLSGRLSVRETMAVIAALDLFLSPDTGPMHMAAAVGTPSVSVFGPSDPARYFSGGTGLPGTRHLVVRRELWCAPCNLIRNPPHECRGGDGPECLRLVTVDDVYAAAASLLRQTARR